MKLIAAVLLAFMLSACQHTLPQPDTPKQAGTEALVAYGLAGSVAHKYLILPFCTSPPTVLPCKTPSVYQSVKDADDAAYRAAVAADNAANDPGLHKTATEKLDALNRLNATPEVQAAQVKQ